MELLGAPLGGYIHPEAWVRPLGNPDFKVTKNAAQHVASGGPPADDFGDANAADIDAVLCPRTAKVSKVSTVGSANLELDFTDATGRKCRIVLAHDKLPHPVSLGQTVVRGQRVGTVGSTGATAQHLHLQYGYWSVWHWIWLDPWPYLEQNHNFQANPGVYGVNLRANPGLAGEVLGQIKSDGIYVDGKKIAEHGATLLRRPVVEIRLDGYDWLPFTLAGAPALWVARTFVHFL